jgi:phosphate-selective porin
MQQQLLPRLCLGLIGLLCAAASSTAAGSQQAAAATNTTAAAAVALPSFCKTGDAAAYAAAADPTSMSWGGNMLKVYRNLYHHNKKWYAAVDSSSNASSIDEGMSVNTVLVKLPTTDSRAFQENVKVGVCCCSSSSSSKLA